MCKRSIGGAERYCGFNYRGYSWCSKRREQDLTNFAVFNFIYFMIDINRFIVINCSEVISSDKFFLDKYNLEVALISILLTTISSFAISFSRVSLVSQQVHITNQHSIRLRMAGHPYAVAALNCLKTACFRKGGEQDDQA